MSACAGKTLTDQPAAIQTLNHVCLRGENPFLICDYIGKNAQILETSGCGFAVFSGVADKNASEPGPVCALAQALGAVGQSYSTFARFPQALPLVLSGIYSGNTHLSQAAVSKTPNSAHLKYMGSAPKVHRPKILKSIVA